MNDDCGCSAASRYITDGPNGRRMGGFCLQHGDWEMILPSIFYGLPQVDSLADAKLANMIPLRNEQPA